MSELDERTVTISGVKVVFPCKPYPSQFGMMDRVIKGLDRKQNSLLESPTGSGKSLALLCSALAWQVAQHEKITRENLAAESGACNKLCHCGAGDKNKPTTEYSPGSKPGCCKTEEHEKHVEPTDELDDIGGGDDDDDFKPSSTKMRTPNIGQGMTRKRKHLGIKYEDDRDSCTDNPPVKCMCNDSAGNDFKKREKVPKIYFGTRTHKQIAQITRELRKTAYHDVRMVILASREYTCVHPAVTKLKNKSEGCRERLDIHGEGCKFFDKSKRVFLSQGQLQDELTTAWDLEDFVGSCKNKKACPYFVTRNIKEGADIVFCPYNYLIDPLVRKSMEINLKDQVVILDEAHNMEDCAREAASGSLTTDQITQTIHNLQQLLEHNVKYVEHLKLKNMLESLLNFIEANNSNLDQSDYDTSYKVWSGFDIVVRLKGIGLGPDSFLEYQRCFEQAIAQSEDDQTTVRDRRNKEVKLSSSSQKILEQLFQILDYMYRNDLKFVEDYRVAIMKSMQYVANRDTNDRWLGKNRRGGSRIVVFTINFWCMNPAVAFSDFNSCRNVVLSSGTLSPMSSFSTELGTPFPIQLEASHIIEDKQVWVGAVGVGPGGHQLQAVYRNMETFDFQDELGNLIYKVCTKVPHGVLCFLPSYRALEKFTERWKLTGLWGKIASRKRIMVEPRASDREDFDGMMKAFYEVIKGDLYNGYLNEDECGADDSEIDGALFFAVCRGKVSEGMDFTDNNARAVITVGIPFPNIKDVQVKLKREYNDKHRIDRGLLSGSDWYEIQAFRALNQALGRCIRHRKDWGALIIVDDRFVKRADKYCKSLSRWVRSKVQTYNVFSDFLGSLSTFTERMVKEMPVVHADTSFIPCTPVSARRDSMYKGQSMDNSYINNSVQGSPYFSPPMSQRTKLRPSPDTSIKRGNSSGTKGSHSAPCSPAVASPSIQQQIMSVINSGTGPKDQPYYVILNQGTPAEQTYLIEPNERRADIPNVNPVQTQLPHMLPSMLTGQPVCLNMSMPGTSQQQQVLLSVPPPGTSHQQQFLLPVPPMVLQGTSLLQNQLFAHSTQPQGTNQQNVIAKGLNQPGMGDNSSGEKNEHVLTEDKKAEMVFSLGSSSLPAEEQLRRFVNSGEAPRNKAYYLVVNKGEITERSFFIEPTKKGKSKPDSGKKPDPEISGVNPVQGEHESTEVVVKQEHKPTEVVVKQEHEPTEVVVKQEHKMEELVLDSSTVIDPEPQNKFLKFCQLPKTPAKVPVAMVTPQRSGNSAQKPWTGAISPVKSDPHHNQQQPIMTTNDQQQFLAERQLPTCTSPVLFEDTPALASDTSNAVPTGVLQTNDTTDIENELTAKKKPIFKKRSSLSAGIVQPKANVNKSVECKAATEDLVNMEFQKIDADKKFGEVKIEKVDNDLDFKFESTGSNSRTKPTIRGKVNRSVIDQVKQGSKISANGEDKTVLREVLVATSNAKDEIFEATGDDTQSDEEFLNTRRRGGRKRKSTSKYEEWSKRPKKGVVYDNDNVGDENENNTSARCLSCAKCGKNWMKTTQYEKQKRHPKFVAPVFKKNTELLYISCLKKDESSLTSVTAETNSNGLTLNSVYDGATGCCIEYIQCRHCNTDAVIGARVLLADSTSQFRSGQTWILSSAANL